MLIKNVFIIAIFICINSLKLYSQELPNPLKTFKEKREFIYGIDNRRTHIKEHSTLIYGAYIGIGFGGKLRFKTGISVTPFERGKVIDEYGHLRKNKLLFVNLGEEFDFYIYKKFRLTTYLQTGIGYNYFRKINNSEVEVEKGKNLIIPIEIGMHIGYDIFPWLRMKLGGGWRFVLPDYSADLSGYYIKAGFGVNSKKLISAVKNKNLFK